MQFQAAAVENYTFCKNIASKNCIFSAPPLDEGRSQKCQSRTNSVKFSIALRLAILLNDFLSFSGNFFSTIIIIITTTILIILIPITIYRDLAIVLNVPTQSKPRHTLTVLINPPHLENIEKISEIYRENTENVSEIYLQNAENVCEICLQNIKNMCEIYPENTKNIFI